MDTEVEDDLGYSLNMIYKNKPGVEMEFMPKPRVHRAANVPESRTQL